MKVENNITVYAGHEQEKRVSVDNVQNEKIGDEERKTIFAGDIVGDFNITDRVQKRIEEAQKQAFKIVSDAWDGDRKIDQEIGSRRQHIEDMAQQNKQAWDTIHEVEDMKAELRESYGLSDEDMELMSRYFWKDDSLTDAEKEYCSALQGTQAYGEYMMRVSELSSFASESYKVLASNRREMLAENAAIRGIREERRKVHPVADAQEQAEEVMEAAREDAVSMVMDDAKEHLDEEQEKRKEEAEAIKEEKEKQEEILEERKEKNEELEELMEDMPLEQMYNMDKIQTEVQQEVKNLLNQMNLAVEDIKGSMVDINI